MQLRKVAKIYRRLYGGEGGEQVFTPTIQTCQKLERTVKLGLFFLRTLQQSALFRINFFFTI